MSDLLRNAVGARLANATREQIVRANAAVEANLTNGENLWGSAQGYSCALTAIMDSDEARTPRLELSEANVAKIVAAFDDVVPEWVPIAIRERYARAAITALQEANKVAQLQSRSRA